MFIDIETIGYKFLVDCGNESGELLLRAIKEATPIVYVPLDCFHVGHDTIYGIDRFSHAKEHSYKVLDN